MICPNCARLKVDVATLAAALRGLSEAPLSFEFDNEWGWVKPNGEGPLLLCAYCDAEVEWVDENDPANHKPNCVWARAALSDAGKGKGLCCCNCHYEREECCSDCVPKGWVPPEVVKQARRQAGDAFIEWAEANASRIHRDALDEAAMGFAAGHAAALDALKEK